MSTFGDQLGRVRRHWWIVAVFAVLGLAAAVGASMLQHTTYTGRAALIVSSNGRSPDQDAVLVQGYVDYFNADGYQRGILAAAQVPAGIVVTAKTAAASPIMLVEATARDATAAGEAATNIAEGFRANMNRIRSAGNADAVNAVKKQLAEVQATAGPSPGAAVVAEISSLQNQLQALESDQTNQLQLLQPDGGVAKNAPPLIMNGVFGLVGGFLMGCIAALAVAAVRGRLLTAADIAEATGLDTLVQVPGGAGDDPRRRKSLRQLAALVATAELPDRAVIAAVAPAGGGAVARLSSELCETLRAEGGTVRLVHASRKNEVADLHGGTGERTSGDLGRIPLLGVGGAAGRGEADVGRRIDHLRASGRFSVVDTSAAEDIATTSALCAAVDAVLVVIELDNVRAADAAEAAELLRQIGVPVLGTVSVASESGRRRQRLLSWGMRHGFRRGGHRSDAGDRIPQASSAPESA